VHGITAFTDIKQNLLLLYTLHLTIMATESKNILLSDTCVQTNVPRSASFNVRHVPLTNLTNQVQNMDMIQEDKSSTSTEFTPAMKLNSVL